MFRSPHRLAQLSTQLKVRVPFARISNLTLPTMSHLFEQATPAEVKNGNGLSLITMNTPNGQKIQIMLEELADTYKNIEWSTTLMYDCLRLVLYPSSKPEILTSFQQHFHQRAKERLVSPPQPEWPYPRHRRSHTKSPFPSHGNLRRAPLSPQIRRQG